MPKVIVEVIESFVVQYHVKELVVTGITNKEELVIDGPRILEFRYTAGQQLKFSNKKSAQAFVKAHGTKVKIL